MHETDAEFTETLLHSSNIAEVAATLACAACTVPGRGDRALVLVATNIGIVRTFELSKGFTAATATTTTSSSSSSSVTVVESDFQTHMKNIVSMTAIGCGSAPLKVAGADELDASGAEWACANDRGTVAVWGRTGKGGWVCVASFSPQTPDPCTSLAFHPTCPAVIAAHASGHLRVYSLESHALALEVAAHARPIMAMDAVSCMGRPIVVTASEDTWIRGWSLPVKLSGHSADNGGSGSGGGSDGHSSHRLEALQKDLEKPSGRKGGRAMMLQEELVLSYPEDRVAQVFCTHKKTRMWTGVQFLEQESVPMLAAVAYDDPHFYLYIPQ